MYKKIKFISMRSFDVYSVSMLFFDVFIQIAYLCKSLVTLITSILDDSLML